MSVTALSAQSQLLVDEFADISLLDRCVAEVRDNLVEYPEVVVYGRRVKQRRCLAFFSDTAVGYQYSKQCTAAQPLGLEMRTLLEEVNRGRPKPFNGILVNRYANGSDYISRHSDDETGLDKSGPDEQKILAISWGATRIFRVRDKTTGKIALDVPLTSGSTIAMLGDFQKEFTHEVPVQKKIREERISFTFRRHVVE